MKKSLLYIFVIVLFILSGIAQPVTAQTVVASWSFDALIAPTETVPTVSVISADNGTLSSDANAYLDGTNGSSTWISGLTSPELTTFGGNVLNDPRATPNAGASLALANMSANGKAVVFKFSTVGYTNISITFATRGTSTGFGTHDWAWSIDNSTYTNITSNAANKTSTWSVETVDLSGITDVNNVSAVYLKLTVSGATNASGNNRIDNFVVTSTPPDTQSPVATFLPANSAVDVLIDVIPTITFDEAVLKTDASELVDADLATLVTFTKTDVSGEAVPFSATIDAAKKVITVTPANPLDNSQLYYLAIGAVEDALGNESTGTNATFTTIAAATPTVTITAPVGGEKFYAGQDVTITWTSANVTNIIVEVWVPESGAWQSYVGTTEATLGTVDAVVPADASYGTTYKLRVVDPDNSTTVFSESGEFTVIGVATSITDLRTRFGAGDIVKLNADATVTMLRPFNRSQKYIQDSGAGLLIDDPNPAVLQTAIAIGDNINGLEGKIALYHGLLQIVPTVASVTISSSGNTVTAPEITIPDYITNYLQYESMLIKFKKVNITQGNGTDTFAASTNYTLSDGTNTLVIRTFYSGDGDVVGSVIPTSKMDITVIAGFYDATIQTYPLNMAAMELLSANKAITSFAFNALNPVVTGLINEEAKTITLVVPAGVDKTTLVPTIAISEKATVAPEGGTSTDFTSPVTYTVTAEDGTTAVYTVTVRTQSSLKALTAFSFSALTPAVTGTINETAKTITATVPAGTNRSALVPTITISEYATVDPSSGTARDFTSPVTYTVTAEDGSTAVYTVTVSLATGIDVNLAGRLKLYPVPATTEITAKNIEDVTLIEIFDITGNKRITERCDGEQEITIPVDQLARGIYFMKFTTLTGTHMKRFVKN